MKKRLKQYLTLAVAVMGIAGSKAWAANTGYVDATITVSPIAAVSLSLTNDTWAIGNQDVNTSTVSSTAMRLTNTGDIGVTLQAQILDQSANWVGHANSTTTVNQYILYVATASAAPNPNGSTFNSANILGAVGNNITLADLSGTGGGVVASAGFVDLYYRLDMPVHVSAQGARTTHVRFTGTAN